jgi:ATP-dependent protease ClpP protease subunit
MKSRQRRKIPITDKLNSFFTLAHVDFRSKRIRGIPSLSSEPNCHQAPNCRENPGRSVYIGGVILDELVDSVAPKVLELKASSLAPLTVYINSPGGHTSSADALVGLLKSPDADKKRPWIITVAVGKAKSAASDLLVFGDYAIAYPTAQIHFHGLRFSELREVTAERASSAAIIAEENTKMASQLAQASIPRAVLRYAMQKSKFDEVRKVHNKPDMSDVECFAFRIWAKVKSENTKAVLLKAFKRCEAIQKISAYVGGKVKVGKSEGKLKQSQYDVKVLKAVLDYELRTNGKKSWTLDDEGLAAVFQDYLLLRDFHLGEHNRLLRSMVSRFGPSFLFQEQLSEYETISGAPQEERDSWLWTHTPDKVKLFWYYIVCVCRNLQEEENPLSPAGAYWLGAINEVVGTNLAALRRTTETVAASSTFVMGISHSKESLDDELSRVPFKACRVAPIVLNVTIVSPCQDLQIEPKTRLDQSNHGGFMAVSEYGWAVPLPIPIVLPMPVLQITARGHAEFEVTHGVFTARSGIPFDHAGRALDVGTECRAGSPELAGRIVIPEPVLHLAIA